ALMSASKAEQSAEEARQAKHLAEEKTASAVVAQQAAKRNYDELQDAQEKVKQESERAQEEARKARAAARREHIARLKEQETTEQLWVLTYLLQTLNRSELRAGSYLREG